MKRHGCWLLFVGGAILLGMGLAACCAPWLTPFDPAEVDLDARLLPPSGVHRLGTDQLGRDLFARMLYGARISLGVGAMASGLSVLLGSVIGGLAGYRSGGWLDICLMRTVDVMLCFPSIFLILAAVAFLGPSTWHLILILGLTGWMGLARLVRAEVLSLKEREFVLAARAIGVSSVGILFKHILPNAMAPVWVHASLGVGYAILAESALSFLGIGVQPPTPSWGNILAEGKATLGYAWWLSLFPGLAIFMTVLACNMVGEGLRQRWG